MRFIITILFAIGLLNSCSKSITNLKYEDLIVEESHVIPEKLKEISGLQYYQNRFYGINDSGGEPEIYSFNLKNPQELKTIRIDSATNIDWEDIAISDSLILVGDFGNNVGNRKNQTIYLIEKDNLDLNLNYQDVKSRAIQFFYPEQEDFDKNAYHHNYDMESLVYFNDEIHLFTKEWKDENTRHFTLDLVKGVQPAWLVEEFKLGFLATAADVIQLNDKKYRLGIVGYNKKGEVFLMLTDFDHNSKKWLDNPKSTIKIGEADELGQVEGIAFINKNKFCISSEAIDSDLGKKEQNVRCISLK